MKLLFLVGQLYPIPSNNAKLMGKLVSIIGRQNEVRVLSLSYNRFGQNTNVCNGVKTYFLNCETKTTLQSVVPSIFSRFIDPKGNSDYLLVREAKKRIWQIEAEFPFDYIVACSEPFPAAVILSQFLDRKSILYLMDPPECIRNDRGTPYRNRLLWKVLRSIHLLVTSPFIHQALLLHHSNALDHCIVECVGFPMIDKGTTMTSQSEQTGQIRLLFSGWMCSDIRSPRYFLDILSQLDERFVVTFMGRECEKLTERFEIKTKAELITLPQQPYETALQAMADADIMINIGNSVPVHMPSKTLEYINTGKPFVNFYKMDDCPTLYYTKRYPLCLNLSENDPDIGAAADRFIEFCLANKGKTVDRAFIESEYADCTPEYIAQKILDALEA